jgi:ATP-dependent Clp protease adaptor protein ClpS
MPQKTTTERRASRASKPRPEPPYNVILHNDWENSMVRVVAVLRRVIPGMSLRRATAIMWTAHTTGRATVKRCHKELAELYRDRLLAEGLTASIEPA